MTATYQVLLRVTCTLTPKAIQESTLESHLFPSHLPICLLILFPLLNVIDEIKTSRGEKDEAPDSRSIKTQELPFLPPLYITVSVTVFAAPGAWRKEPVTVITHFPP